MLGLLYDVGCGLDSVLDLRLDVTETGGSDRRVVHGQDVQDPEKSIHSNVDLLDVLFLIRYYFHESVMLGSNVLHLYLQLVNLCFVEDTHKGSKGPQGWGEKAQKPRSSSVSESGSRAFLREVKTVVQRDGQGGRLVEGEIHV